MRSGEATGAQLYKMEHEEFTDIVTDTRKITPGVLFLAFKGERFNGEDFVRDAVEKGASGVMVSTGCPKEQLAGLKTTVLIAPDTLAAYQQLAHAWRHALLSTGRRHHGLERQDDDEGSHGCGALGARPCPQDAGQLQQ